MRVLEAETGADGLKSAMFGKPDLVILDLGLPDIEGSDVLEQILRLVEHARDHALDRVRRGRKGPPAQIRADDYVVKPFGIAELLARSEAALRRYFKSRTESPVVVAGPLSINLVARSVTVGGVQIKLTRKEYRLLHVLATHVGLVVTHDQLLKDIWSGNQRDNIQYLRILVRKLRQKIEADPNRPRLLLTESGVGYRLRSQFSDPSDAARQAQDVDT